jgi:hypothetical protein
VSKAPALSRKPPQDPRARKVVRAVISGNIYALTLECGHEVRRKFLCPPSRVVCHACPAPGGMGGNLFERPRPAK